MQKSELCKLDLNLCVAVVGSFGRRHWLQSWNLLGITPLHNNMLCDLFLSHLYSLTVYNSKNKMFWSCSTHLFIHFLLTGSYHRMNSGRTTLTHFNWNHLLNEWAVCLICKVRLFVHVCIPQSFVKGLAREFLLEELGDVLPVHLILSCWSDSWTDSWTAFHFLVLLQVCGAVHRLVLMFTVADEADEVAWKTKRCRDNRTGFRAAFWLTTNFVTRESFLKR